MSSYNRAPILEDYYIDRICSIIHLNQFAKRGLGLEDFSARIYVAAGRCLNSELVLALDVLRRSGFNVRCSQRS